MKNFRLVSRTATLAGLAAVSVGAVHAQSVTPVFISTSGGAGDVTYTYELFSTADTKVQSGDLYTMYDFNGLLGITPAGGGNYTLTGPDAPTFTPGQVGPDYSISVQNTGLNPPNTSLLAGDDPNQPNVTLDYNGTTFINTGPGSQLLGTLVLHSVNAINGAGDFTPFASNTTKNSDGTPAGNQGFLAGPNNAVSGTPEPGTWAMFVGMGVSGLAFARRKRRK